MKIYARQINPEYQESPLFLCDLWPDGVILDGNRDYNSHVTDEYRQIVDYLDEMAGRWQDDGYWYQRIDNPNNRFDYHYEKVGKKHEYTVAEMLSEYGFERPDGKPWSSKQKHEWKLLMESDTDVNDDDCILVALSLLTGHEWKLTTIRGCCQSDWQYCYYQADMWDKKSLKAFETEYFNTGSEWMIHDEADEPESPEDISGFTTYCTSWREEDIRQELADAAGGNADDVVMYAWNGRAYSDKYRLVV